MDINEIIQGYYINEAKVNKIITRNQEKKLNKKNLPVANLSNTLPVIPEKIYSRYTLRLRFIRDEEDDKENLLQYIFLFLLYFYVSYYLVIWFN